MSLDFLPLLGLKTSISGAQYLQMEYQVFQRGEMGSLLPRLSHSACSLQYSCGLH